MSEPTVDVKQPPQQPGTANEDIGRNESGSVQRSWRSVIGGISVALIAFAILVFMSLPTRFEDDFQQHKELYALLTLMCFFVFGLAIIAVIPHLYPDLRGSKTVIGLLLVVPLLAFLLLTDRISSLSGAGVSLTVSNIDNSGQPVGQNPLAFTTEVAGDAVCTEPVPYTVPLEVSLQEDQDAITRIWAEITPEATEPGESATQPPVALGPTNYWKLTLRTCDYNAFYLQALLEAAIEAGNFRFILLVDDMDRFFAYIPASDAVRLFTNQAEGIVTAINERPEDLRLYNGIVFSPVTRDDTALEAIARMREQNLDMIPIMDDDGIVRSVVTLDQMLASLVLELATSVAD